MDDDARREFLDRVARYQQRDDPTGWCDKVYSDAGGDPRGVFWADLAPNPYLLAWLGEQAVSGEGKRAAAVGCGVGDDAEALAAHAYRVTAFDIAPAAIELCRGRYPDSRVDYRVADLFDPPHDWVRGFDLVYECNTIQILPGVYRLRALAAIAGMVAPGGVALVSCRSRLAGEKEGEFPLPLDRAEIDGFMRAGLRQAAFVAYDDDQDPPVPHFFAAYRRAPAGQDQG